MLRPFIGIRRALYSSGTGTYIRRQFSTGKPSGNTPETGKMDPADQARMSQNLWDFMVPERNIGVTHPFFLVLLVLTLSLHYYNKARDNEEDERLRLKRLNRKQEGSH